MSSALTHHDAIRNAASESAHLLACTDLGVSPGAMARMEREGVLERIVPGIYIGAGQQQHPLVEAAAWTKRHPHAVVCLLSAAAHHGLTDAFARGTWLYVPKGASPPRSKYSPVHVVQAAPWLIDPGYDDENGVVTERIHGVDVRLTGPDRTVIDLWRYPRKVSSEHALHALRRRYEQGDFRLPALARMARRFEVWHRLEPVLQGLALR